MRMTYGQAYATISRAGAEKTCCECGVSIKQRQTLCEGEILPDASPTLLP
jgi:NMD protein affecting ribosome stability and mRNA decay